MCRGIAFGIFHSSRGEKGLAGLADGFPVFEPIGERPEGERRNFLLRLLLGGAVGCHAYIIGSSTIPRGTSRNRIPVANGPKKIH